MLEELIDNMIIKGAEIEFEHDQKTKEISGLVMKSKPKEENWADEIVDFETLLNDAHAKGLSQIQTTPLQIEMKEKFAIFKAKAFGTKGEFEATGDATQDNISSVLIKPHWIRMAETRAICRALRFYTNNAKCSKEEK